MTPHRPRERRNAARATPHKLSPREFHHGLLVVAQVSLALIMLIGSGLMIRTFQKLLSVDPGFSHQESILVFAVSIPRSIISSNLEARRFQRHLLDELSSLPGVESAAATSALPLSRSGSQDGLWIEGHMPPEGQLPPIRAWKFVTGNYFETLGRTLVTGRTIVRQDLEEGRQVVVISENLALEYWPTADDAIGRRVKPNPETEDWWQVVGVVSDVYSAGIDQEPPKHVYFPAANPDLWGQEQYVARNLEYIIRAEPSIDPHSMVSASVHVVASLNPNLPVSSAETMEQIYRDSFARPSFTLTLLAIAAAVALLLGLIGVYATLSYIISQRTQEFGLRIALGAQLKQVRWMVLRQGFLLGSVGVAVGLVGAFAATRVLSRMVYGVSATDALTFFSVSVGLIVTVLLAALLAARRATSVSPLTALRGD